MRVDDVDAAREDLSPQSPRSSRIQLGGGTAVDRGQRDGSRTLRQGLARASGNDRPVPAPGQLAREPQRLTLAATPAFFRVDVQHSERHGAQLPFSVAPTQAAAEISEALNGMSTS